ncbi:MAG: 1-deoxy-D-xylulose-5-phosphate reductoisomerase [Chloroflexi bacterium]|nr:1-deoxy-D-xylulose-5-phosphate reductoisomerase [Chloroflexota bacterium]
MDRPLRIAILGSTGSIGQQTLDVVRRYPQQLSVVALAARQNESLLLEQVRAFRPRVACLTGRREWNVTHQGTRFLWGTEALTEVVTLPEVDIVVAAMSGNDGFRPLIEAIRAGKQIALANKESLVMAGTLVTQEADRAGCSLRPVDSEHSAIWQCLQGEERDAIASLSLTASGGPFRTWSTMELAMATPEQALRHPTWSMGQKITIDSATLINKGLEIIEAHWLFRIPYSQIHVLIHPQSVVHSFVQFRDGSLKAQLGTPDMRLPIAYALSWPERWDMAAPPVDLVQVQALSFSAPDEDRFPLLRLARAAGEWGGTAPTVLCAADEVAVQAFLGGRLSWWQLHEVVEKVVMRLGTREAPSLEDILEADRASRSYASELVEHFSRHAVR